MFTKDNFNKDNFDDGLVDAVGDRILNSAYTDSILAGTKYLTQFLRDKGSCEGDGSQLVGQVLGGTAPKLPINSLQSVSEKDEQKGLEQIIRGFYVCIRNPRTHEITEDTEEYCIRIMVLIDTLLSYLKRETEEFDVAGFVDRIYDPHFVASKEYAETLISQVPENRIIDVFRIAFGRRAEGRIKEIKFAFRAMYQLMPQKDVSVAIELVGEVLRKETETKDIANLFRLLKPRAWGMLQDDVKQRIENMVIDSCKVGHFDIYSGIDQGSLGTWGNTFGKYFTRRDDLANAIISRLESNWYTQNYIANYFIYSLPSIVRGDEKREELAENLAYAALSNNAKLVRNELLDACENYPNSLKEQLRVSVQERRQYDPNYADKLLEKLS
ncbi:hypothetical protein TW85_11575 [Marinomonas sp. S3726]|nr:hypothetical protein TW85_11575 [Marinomonas sp. S3726]